MKLPFVSRSTYEDLKQLLTDERERTRYLMDLVADMKVSGAAVQRLAPAAGRAKLEPKPKSAIQQAIDENPHAGNNPRLRSYLAKWAERELDRGISEQEVEDRLRTWHLASEEDDDDDDNSAIPIG